MTAAEGKHSGELEWLRLNPSDGPVPIEVTLKTQGRPKKGQEKGVIHTFLRGSGKREYTLARLARDYPEIRDAYDRGEYKSVRAAAIAAGIVKVKSPLDQLRAWWKKASETERTWFLKCSNV